MKLILPTLLLILLNFASFGQFRLGLNFDYYKPQQSFAENIDTPLGISFTGIYRFPESRFSIGGDLGVSMYANRNYDYDLSEEGAPGEVITIDEEDCFLHFNAIGRYSLYESSIIQTYAELRTGIYTFFSTRVAEKEHRLYDDQTEFHGTSFNTGLGGGVSVNLSNLFSNKEITNPIFLDFNSSYNTGTRASYRNMGNEAQVVTGLNSGKYKSLVNHINLKFGVSMRL